MTIKNFVAIVAIVIVTAIASHVWTMNSLCIETDGDGDSALVTVAGHEWFYGINGYEPTDGTCTDGLTAIMSSLKVDTLTIEGVWDEDGIPCASAGNWILDGEFITGEEVTIVYADMGTECVYDDLIVAAFCEDGYSEIYEGAWM